MRKSQSIVLVIITILVLISSYGATIFTGKFQLQIYNNGDQMLSKEYKIKTATLMTVLFKYSGNFYKYYCNNRDEEKVKDFTCINDEIGKDVKKIVDKIEKPIVEGEIFWDKQNAEFSFQEGENGIMVDRNQLIENLYKDIKAKTVLTVPTKEIPHKDTVEDLKNRTYERATFTTGYGSSKSNRKHNIELAVSKLNGEIIPPTTQFSFNKTVGPRTAANGFRTAGIISGGTFVQGVGGGVCQVSTTLFNAWVRAGLDVINATNHSLPVTYIEPSLDAMVSSRNDLLLYNNTPHNVYIKALTKDNRIDITIYGLYTEETVRLRTEIIKVLPCNEYEIEERHLDWQENETQRIVKQPKNGLISVAYKEIYINGKKIKSEKYRTNKYASQKGKIIKRPDIAEKEEEKESKILEPSYSTLFTIVPSLVSVSK